MSRRLIPLLLAALAALLVVSPAAAHPLGNFTVSQYSRLETQRDGLRVRYIVDMAEIPAFQERAAIDADGDGAVSDAEAQRYLARRAPELAAGLHLELDGAPATLALVSQSIDFPAGQGGLSTLRITLDLTAPAPADARVRYTVTNYESRQGWREIVVQAGEGRSVRELSAPAEDRSAGLTAYPEDMLSSPLDVREVRFVAAPGASGGGASAAAASPATATSDALAALVAERELTPAGMGAALLLALLLGAGHALAPGHGKTIVGAYLVGSRGTALHAVVLGLVTTATHTAGVFALGFVTLTLSHYVLPEQLYPWLELLSGALVAVIGVGLLLSRIAGLLHRRRADAAHAPDHHHGPGGHSTGVVGAPLHHHGPGGHTHDHGEALADELAGRLGGSATSPRRTSWRGLVALGVSGGLLPCPSALVVLLGAIALGRVGFGMLLIVAFSLGLAAVLTGIGLLLVYARGLIERVPTDSRILRAMPLASAAAVIIAGVGITAAALGQL